MYKHDLNIKYDSLHMMLNTMAMNYEIISNKEAALCFFFLEVKHSKYFSSSKRKWSDWRL